jgi:SAM-dependent methyltransferase
MKPRLFLPSEGASEHNDVWSWYLNIPLELQEQFLSPAQSAYLSAYYRGAGLLRPWRRSFFRHHYSRTFAEAAHFILAALGGLPVVDLGCGCGTQSLYLATKGSRVIALDVDGNALDVLRRRKAFYEDRMGRSLDLKVEQADALAFDYGEVAPIGGLHSMFSFNMMQPNTVLLDRMAPHWGPGARLAVLDGNSSCWLCRALPRRRRDVWSPLAFERALEKHGFGVREHSGGVAIPAPAWCCLPHGLLSRVDSWLSRSWFFSASHLVLAVRQADESPGHL